MVSSTRQAIAGIVFIVAIAANAQAQTTPAKDQTASISGKVTLKEKAAPGIVVVLTEDKYAGWQRFRYRATTDAEGNYRLTNIPAGNYYVFPLAPAFVPDKDQSKQLVVVAAGETLRDVDFALVRGGVITGKITDAEGQPLIDEYVTVAPVDPSHSDNQVFPFNFNNNQTDDRGIYRAFGLRPGKYRVSVGRSGSGLPDGGAQTYRQTFYPSVTEVEKATVIEVTEGSETDDVDIVLSRPIATFTVSGRVIDAETSAPVTTFGLGIQQSDANGSTSTSSGERFNKDGKFKLDGVRPGKYTVFIVPPAGSEWRSDALTFEVVDKDLSGLEVKMNKGAAISGVVVFDGPTTAKLADVRMFPVLQRRSPMFGGIHVVAVGSDGAFKVNGIPAGTVYFSLSAPRPFSTTDFEVVSIERNGVLQPDGIAVKDGEVVTDVRVLVKPVNLTGSIRGQVKLENGELDPSMKFSVSVNRVSENQSKLSFRSSSNSPEVDARGRFLLDHLAPGNYELSVFTYQPQPRALYETSKQQVTVTENSVTEVTVVLKAKQ